MCWRGQVGANAKQGSKNGKLAAACLLEQKGVKSHTHLLTVSDAGVFMAGEGFRVEG